MQGWLSLAVAPFCAAHGWHSSCLVVTGQVDFFPSGHCTSPANSWAQTGWRTHSRGSQKQESGADSPWLSLRLELTYSSLLCSSGLLALSPVPCPAGARSAWALPICHVQPSPAPEPVLAPAQPTPLSSAQPCSA